MPLYLDYGNNNISLFYIAIITPFFIRFQDYLCLLNLPYFFQVNGFPEKAHEILITFENSAVFDSAKEELRSSWRKVCYSTGLNCILSIFLSFFSLFTIFFYTIPCTTLEHYEQNPLSSQVPSPSLSPSHSLSSSPSHSPSPSLYIHSSSPSPNTHSTSPSPSPYSLSSSSPSSLTFSQPQQNNTLPHSPYQQQPILHQQPVSLYPNVITQQPPQQTHQLINNNNNNSMNSTFNFGTDFSFPDIPPEPLFSIDTLTELLFHP